MSHAQDSETTDDYPAFGAFVQPSYSENCCPMDSSYEKRTLDILRDAQAAAAVDGPAFDIVKPLVDMTIIFNGFVERCRPDFVLEITPEGKDPYLLPIETMGRGDADYYTSKDVTIHACAL